MVRGTFTRMVLERFLTLSEKDDTSLPTATTQAKPLLSLLTLVHPPLQCRRQRERTSVCQYGRTTVEFDVNHVPRENHSNPPRLLALCQTPFFMQHEYCTGHIGLMLLVKRKNHALLLIIECSTTIAFLAHYSYTACHL